MLSSGLLQYKHKIKTTKHLPKQGHSIAPFTNLHAHPCSPSFLQERDDSRLAISAYGKNVYPRHLSDFCWRSRKGNEWNNSQQMPDLSFEAGQGRLVDAVLGDQKFIFKSQCQLCQVDVSIKAKIQGLEIRTSSGESQVLSSESRKWRLTNPES